MDWLTEVDRLFDYTELSDDRKVKFVAYRLKRGSIGMVGQIEGDEDEKGARSSSNMA